MYYVIKSEYVTDSNEKITVYGIKSENISFENVTVSKARVEELCKKCNECKLSEIHIKDVINDFIDEPAFCNLAEKPR